MKLFMKKGYDFFEVSSTVQKAIRRNDEEVALYFTVEMFNSGYDEYLWERLMIITSEDVGLAEPNIAANINALYQMYSVLKKKKKDNRPERLHLINAVVQLCRAKKSRHIDWLVIRVWREHDAVSMPIPDYAYDSHNQKGKRMGRGLDHFYNESTKLDNHFEIIGEAEAKTKAYDVHKNAPDKLNFSGMQTNDSPNSPELDLK